MIINVIILSNKFNKNSKIIKRIHSIENRIEVQFNNYNLQLIVLAIDNHVVIDSLKLSCLVRRNRVVNNTILKASDQPQKY